LLDFFTSYSHAHLGTHWKLGTLSAHEPFKLPISLSVSNFGFDGLLHVSYGRSSGSFYFILYFDRISSFGSGVSASFKRDPLKSIQIDSSFSYISTVRHYLQDFLEGKVQLLVPMFLPMLTLIPIKGLSGNFLFLSFLN